MHQSWVRITGFYSACTASDMTFSSNLFPQLVQVGRVFPYCQYCSWNFPARFGTMTNCAEVGGVEDHGGLKCYSRLECCLQVAGTTCLYGCSLLAVLSFSLLQIDFKIKDSLSDDLASAFRPGGLWA